MPAWAGTWGFCSGLGTRWGLVVLAYERARWLAQKGDGVIVDDDNHWHCIEAGAFTPLQEGRPVLHCNIFQRGAKTGKNTRGARFFLRHFVAALM